MVPSVVCVECYLGIANSADPDLSYRIHLNLTLNIFCFLQFADDVYLPTDEPHGTIEATLSRAMSKL